MKENNKFYIKSVLLSTYLAILLLLLFAADSEQQHATWTRSYDMSRTNANLEETILNTSNVNHDKFGSLFTRSVTGHVYSQVLYIPNLLMPQDGKTHNVIFVATMGNNLYAFDADDPNADQPLWQRNFGPTLPISDGVIGAPSAHCAVYTDIFVEVGIVSTPVIDRETNTLYLVHVNKESNDPYIVRHRLRAIDILTGNDRANSPVVVEGEFPGTGDGSVDGVVPFTSLTQNQRLALTLINGNVYFAFGSYCTKPIYHGWLFGYDKTTLQRKFVWCTTPNGKEGSIWQSGQGLVYDGTYAYMVTANGYFSAGTDWGNSYLKIDLTKTVVGGRFDGTFDVQNGLIDYFTPYNWRELWDLDLDMGTAGPLLIPNTNLIFSCSKQGYCYLVDKNDMGHHSDTSNTCIQTFKPNPNSGTDYPKLNTGTHGGATYWQTSRGTIVYVWPIDDVLKGFVLKSNGKLGTLDIEDPIKSREITPAVAFPGGIISLSANGFTAGSGIIWATHSTAGSSNRQLRPGVLRAYNAENLAELWNSNMVPCRDGLGELAKFNTPMVANGKVYVPSLALPPETQSKVHVYGIMTTEQASKNLLFDSCCLDSYLCDGSQCCNGACYDPALYYCPNHVLCPVGQTCQTNSICDLCPNNCCNGMCYNPNELSCISGKVCRSGQKTCGTSQKCYYTDVSSCVNGEVVERVSSSPDIPPRNISSSTDPLPSWSTSTPSPTPSTAVSRSHSHEGSTTPRTSSEHSNSGKTLHTAMIVALLGVVLHLTYYYLL